MFSRQRLHDAIDKNKSLTSPEVVGESQELDDSVNFNIVVNECLKLLKYTQCIEIATGYKGQDRPNLDGLNRTLLRMKGE